MIRDPSDGSVKKSAPGLAASQNTAERVPKREPGRPGADANWGLKSLDREPRKPKPAPTAAELAEHYGKFNLGFQPKNEEL